MQVVETKREGLLREYKVAVPAGDIAQKLNDKLIELARSVKLPGFRPGKVPINVVRQRYGQAVTSEVLEQAISESSRAVIEEHGLRPATSPKLALSGYADQGDLEYTLAVEVLPDIVPPDYSQIAVERLVAEVDDDYVATLLQRLALSARQFTDVSEARPAGEGDAVVVDVVGPEDRKGFVGAQGENVTIEAGAGGPMPGLGEQVLGISVGDRKTIEITFPADYPIGELAGQNASYEIVVKKLREAPSVPIDDALAQRLNLPDLEALKTAVRDDRARELKQLSRLRLKRELLDRLAEMYTFDVPVGLLDREYQNVVRQLAPEAAQGEVAHDKSDHGEHPDHNHDHDHTHCDHPDHHHPPAEPDVIEASGQEGATADGSAPTAAPASQLTDEQRAEFRELAVRRVKLGLVLAEIGRNSNLTVSPEELSKAIISEARRYPGQEQTVIDYFRKHAEARESLSAPIFEDKVVDYILEMATVNDRKVSVEELMEYLEEPTDGAHLR